MLTARSVPANSGRCVYTSSVYTQLWGSVPYPNVERCQHGHYTYDYNGFFCDDLYLMLSLCPVVCLSQVGVEHNGSLRTRGLLLSRLTVVQILSGVSVPSDAWDLGKGRGRAFPFPELCPLVPLVSPHPSQDPSPKPNGWECCIPPQWVGAWWNLLFPISVVPPRPTRPHSTFLLHRVHN